MSASQDLTPLFDPTAYPSITGEELYQLVAGSSPVSDTGFVIVTTDVGVVPTVPNAVTTTKWQRYVWLRRSATSVSAYLWNPTVTSDPTYLKWVGINLAALGTGVIQGYMIADNTITDDKIIALDYSKLTGVPTSFTPGGAAGGDLTGTYPDPSVATSAITTAKIADANVTTAKIADANVTTAKIADNNVTNAKLAYSGTALAVKRTNAAGTAVEDADIWITKMANPASAADVDKVPVVTSPYTDGYVLRSFNRTIQSLAKAVTGNQSVTYNGADPLTFIPLDSTIPQVSEGTAITGASLAITPTSATSLIRIRFSGMFSHNTAGGLIAVALFKTGSNDALQCRSTTQGTNGNAAEVVLEFVELAGSTAARTYSIRFGCGNATGIVNFNIVNGTANTYGAAANSILVVEEFAGTLS